MKEKTRDNRPGPKVFSPRLRVFLTGVMLLLWSLQSGAAWLMIPMDAAQKNHLKAYGIAFLSLKKGMEVKWLLNYRGGSFLMDLQPDIQAECVIRGVTFETPGDSRVAGLLAEIASPGVNQDAVSMQKAPRIAVYSPPNKQPWDDAVTLVLTYAEIDYDLLYDEEVISGKLADYDWLHLHHEDFTGQFGKFWRTYQHMPWYQQDVEINQEMARKLGFLKVSEMKAVVSREIRNYVMNGGFLFAMCAATDTYDIALSAAGIDICEPMFDGDPADKDMNSKLDYSRTFAFRNFQLVTNPYEYEFSDIDVTESRKVIRENDYFTLFDFSAKWDPIPTMLCQNHNNLIKGFMGQTTAFKKELVKPEVVIMGENKAAGEARYIHGELGKGFWTFYGGHDPEDYRHLVGDPATDLSLYPTSPGYRLILNNVLFPSAKKKKQKT
ncbi:MAG: hypothetical protein KA780_02995 [Prolixibacteraceae bacterium]|nr:hypothetical protein [Prolixibacteraceae bacterium]HNQ37750.1 hypothetical protein [Prolixibacteraceae bacterium]HOY50156.1 hypothetical protein [Prolixibacteraceae bacterium]